MYKTASSTVSFPKIEGEILAEWERNGTFDKSLKLSERELVFYDGPPFPTGTPHYGTIFVSIIKDALARYFTMAGYSVSRRWGWDCHGLPIENAVEVKLGIKNKTEIEKSLGVAAFNDECRKLVADCDRSWEEYIKKIGRWVDYSNAYRTLDLDFMESTLWVFKQCYEKGLIYKDYRVTPYCYRCETALSFSDIRESDATRARQDPEIIVKFKALDEIGGKPTFYLAWTTTPWTLTSNLALAVGPEHRYAAFEYKGDVLVMAEELLPRWSALFGEKPTVLKSFPGKELVGHRYEPVFPYYRQLADQGYFRVLAGDFVTLEDGVGIVHCAPAFGEEDYWLCKRNGLGVRNPVDSKGCFTAEVPEFAGKNVHACQKDIIRWLKAHGALLLHRTLDHNYPHCWRCRTPLIYRAMDAWYFAVEKIKDRLIQRNEDINWVPDHVKHGRFGKWLEGARDWNISRSRYWGTPIPVWECENTKCAERVVLGSVREVEQYAGKRIKDLHKEFLDTITCVCPACGGTMRRVPEVLDCWFESASMPFGQCHYPFENKAWFENHFPADFIVEYPGQLRGWFYYLHVLAVALLDRAAFKNCLVHGTLLAEDGAKISKSKKNFTDPMDLVDRYGADAVRLYLLNSPAVVMNDLSFRDSGVNDQVKRVLLPLWNSYSFFVTYANVDRYQGNAERVPESQHPLDRWILAVLYHTEKEVGQAFKTFYLNRNLAPIVDFIEQLTNWYIRQSRARFWGGGLTQDKRNAYDTLYYVLTALLRMLAPSAPFIADYLFRNLTGMESVHLVPWPHMPEKFRDDLLIQQTQSVRAVVKLGLSLRQQAGIKVRQPLPGIRFVLPLEMPDFESQQFDVIQNELNVKQATQLDDPSTFASVRVIPNPKTIGPKFGRETQAIIQAAKAGQFREERDKIVVFSSAHGTGSKEWVLDHEDVAISYRGRDGAEVMCDKGILVFLDKSITPELREEGFAGDLNRLIQDLRKKAGYEVSDHILLQIEGKLAPEWKKHLAQQALAEQTTLNESEADATITEDIEGRHYRISIKRKKK